MTTINKKTPEEMECMARWIVEGKLQGYLDFALYFGPRLTAIAKRAGFPETDAEIYAFECCEQIPPQTQRYFDLKARDKTEEYFYEQWVFWKAKLIRRRRHSAIYWTQAQPEAGDESAQERKEAKAYWLEQDYEVLSERMSVAEKAAFLEAYEEALQELPELQRAIFLLREVDGRWPYEDIANKYGLKPSAARVYCHRAKQTLRERLSNHPLLQQRLSAKS
jgi:RNA polymerase sigma factor (sigma-70 family)